MKPLEELTPQEKATLLHQLLPKEIPALLDFTMGICEGIMGDTENKTDDWKGLLTVDDWRWTALSINATLRKNKDLLIDSSIYFGTALFENGGDYLMGYCLTIYTTVRKHPNQKFTLAVALLFNP